MEGRQRLRRLAFGAERHLHKKSGNVIEKLRIAFSVVRLQERDVGHGRDAADLGRKVAPANALGVAKEDGTLHDVLELADVPGPRVLDEGLHGLGLDALHVLLQPLVELDEEMLDEERDVPRALPEGGQADGNDVT